jgi:hypothetical protein
VSGTRGSAHAHARAREKQAQRAKPTPPRRSLRWLGSRFTPLGAVPAARHRVLRADRGVEEIVLDLTTGMGRKWT